MIGRTLQHKQTGEAWKVVGADGDGRWTLQPATFGPVQAFSVEELREHFNDAGNATAPVRASEDTGWKRLGAFIDRAVQRQAHGTYGLLTPEEALQPDAEDAARERAETIAADPEGLLADALIGLLPLSPMVEEALRDIAPGAFEDDDEPPKARPKVGATQAQTRRLGHRA